MDIRKVIPAILTIGGAILKTIFDIKISNEKMNESVAKLDERFNEKVNLLVSEKAVNAATDRILTAVKEVQAEEREEAESEKEA